MKYLLVAAVLVIMVCVGCLWNFSTATGAQTETTFFTLAERPERKGDAEKFSVASVRESVIEINLSGLTVTEKPRLSFPLFDGKTYEAVRESSEIRRTDDFTWRGKITRDKFKGDVILTFKAGMVAGLIYAPDAVYEIIPKGGEQILVEINQQLFPECAGDIQGEKSQTNSSKSANVSADSGDRIDVLILYTTAVKNSLGGETQVQTFAQQAIDATNTAYINSKIRQRVRLVRAQETAIIETGTLGTELSALRTNADATALRNTYNADLVAMLSNSTDNCGIGYLMGGVNGNSNNGFTVTSRGCAVGNLSFAHELGHNMGSQHNPENGSNATFPFSYGHYVNNYFRTVMSYVDPCTSGCTRRPYFSNPAVSFNGFPTGIENLRDNARSINSTADAIANYRSSGTSLTLNTYNGGEAIPRLISRPVNWSSENLNGNVKIELSRDGGTNWETLIADTTNDGSEIIRIFGRPTRQARLRIVSLDDPTVSDSSLKNISIR
ncbi:MAG: M12 family metallo-peptidase [Pyrinomonadaceae bacterium]